MGYRKTSVLKIAGIFVMAFLVISGNSQQVLAYSLGSGQSNGKDADEWETIFKNNHFMFWNPYEKLRSANEEGEEGPEECFIQSGSGDNSGDHWNGNCSGVGSYDNWINTHISTIQAVAKANGLPWEAILAQTIQESGGGKHEPCPYNPLGMRGGGYTKCKGSDGTMYAQFHNYQEAFQAYVDNHIPTREAKNRYPNDPYMYLEFIQHGASAHYAESTTYVQNVSSLVCGIQKWAEAHGHGSELSAKTYRNYPNGIGGSTNNDDSETEGDETTYICPNDVDPPETPSDVDPHVEENSGLTYEQAKQLVIWYGTNKNGSSASATGSTLWDMCNGGGSNCVTFSAFFVNKFTSKHNTSGNGNAFAGNIGVAMGNKPQIFSVFSSSGSKDGHTGVVLGYHDGKWIVAHASCHRDKSGPGDGTLSGNGSGFVVTETNFNPNSGGWSYPGSKYSNYRFAYLENYVNINKIEEYLKNGI